MADFLLLGQQNQGSYALSETMSKMFYQSLMSLLDNIAETINTQAVPELFELNGWERDELPYLAHGKAEPVNLEVLGNFLGRLTDMGMVLDDRLENHLRGIADMPLRDTQQPSRRKSRPASALRGHGSAEGRGRSWPDERAPRWRWRLDLSSASSGLFFSSILSFILSFSLPRIPHPLPLLSPPAGGGSVAGACRESSPEADALTSFSIFEDLWAYCQPALESGARLFVEKGGERREFSTRMELSILDSWAGGSDDRLGRGREGPRHRVGGHGLRHRHLSQLLRPQVCPA